MATTFPVPSPWLTTVDLLDATKAAARTTTAMSDLVALTIARMPKMPLASTNGQVSITPVVNVPTSAAVVFASSVYFNTVPVVVGAAVSQLPGGSNIYGIGVTAITTTGCTLWLTRGNTIVTLVNWIAILDGSYSGYSGYPLANPWVANETLTAAAMSSRLTTQLNSLSTTVNSLIVGQPVACQSGQVTVTPVANVSTAAAFTFATPFASPPQIAVAPYTNVAGTQVKAVTSSPFVTTTGCSVYVYRTNTTATVVYWIAQIDAS